MNLSIDNKATAMIGPLVSLDLMMFKKGFTITSTSNWIMLVIPLLFVLWWWWFISPALNTTFCDWNSFTIFFKFFSPFIRLFSGITPPEEFKFWNFVLKMVFQRSNSKKKSKNRVWVVCGENFLSFNTYYFGALWPPTIQLHGWHNVIYLSFNDQDLIKLNSPHSFFLLLKRLFSSSESLLYLYCVKWEGFQSVSKSLIRFGEVDWFTTAINCTTPTNYSIGPTFPNFVFSTFFRKQ